MSRTSIAAGLAVFLAAAPAAACPDWEGQPFYGDIQLAAGFRPDPWIKSVTAGGTIDLARCFNGGEAGFVTQRPDFDLYWKGTSGKLTIAVSSGADAVLLVNAPDGTWYYNDDYRGNDPAIIFDNPQEGLYDIWIGSYDGSRRNPANLIFTEYDY